MKVLVIGCGSIGRRHIGNLRAVAEQGPIDLTVEVTDADRARADSALREIGADRVVDLKSRRLEGYDACVICTPNETHVDLACEAVDAGCAVFIEKPVAVTTEQADPLLERCADGRAQVMVGCNLRFHAGVRALKQALDARAIGTVYYARATFAHALPNWRPSADYRTAYSARFAQGGGILLDAIHEPDYLSHLLGVPTIQAGWCSNSGALEVDVEDIASMVLVHPQNVRSFVHVDYLRPEKVRCCEIVGADGILRWESLAKAPERMSVQHFDRATRAWRVLYASDEYDQNEQYLAEMEYFVRSVADGVPLINQPHEAVHVLRCIETLRSRTPLMAMAQNSVTGSE